MRGERRGIALFVSPWERTLSTKINIDYLPYHHRDDLRIRTIFAGATRSNRSKISSERGQESFRFPYGCPIPLSEDGIALSHLYTLPCFSPLFFFLFSPESSPTIANSLRGFVEGAQSPENSFFTESPSCLRTTTTTTTTMNLGQDDDP